MANLNDAIQYAIRNLKNAGEIVRNLWNLHFNPNPQDVLTEIYDENGNLRQVRIPNVAKWRDVIWRDAQSAMSKTFYVDPINGSDTTGDGSLNAPFKSITKARDSVPSGGFLNVLLLSDYTLSDESIWISNKFVRIAGASVNPDGSPIITLRNDPNAKGIINVGDGSTLWLDNIKLECNDSADIAPQWSTLLKTGIGKRSTIIIGRWVDLTQSAYPVEITLNYPMLNVENSIVDLILLGTKVISSSLQTLVSMTGNSVLFYTSTVVLDVNGNVTFPQIGIN